MTTATPTTPPAPPARRTWTRLEAPQVALLAVALVAIDLVAALVVLVVRGDPSCTTLSCRQHGVSTLRPVIGLLVAVAVTLGPVLVMWWRRTGLRTTVVVQVVLGGLLIVWAAGSLGTALQTRDAPPPVPTLPSLRPCAAITLAGKLCLTYPATPPPAATTSP